jgi:FkbM family methyltransferase
MEMEEMSFLAHFLRPNDVFYDIGANVGAYSILISQHSKCRVFSFEPHPKTFDLLQRNISIQKNNQLIQAYNFGLGEKSSFVKFTSNLDTVNHVSSNINEETIEVQINVLDDLNIPIPTSIKIDVEGFEYAVILGAINTITKYKPVIYYEKNSRVMTPAMCVMANLPYRNSDIYNVERLLTCLGYNKFTTYNDNILACIA